MRIALLILCVFFILPPAYSQDWKWLKKTATPPSPGELTDRSITTDAAGNVYVVGTLKTVHYSSVTIGCNEIATMDLVSAYIAKYDPSGKVIWAKKIANVGLTSFNKKGIKVDAAGNIYVIGDFVGTAIFGNYTLASSGLLSSYDFGDIFIAKFDASGRALWAKSAGTANGAEHITDLVIDEAGNSHITGYFAGASLSFGKSTLINGRAGVNKMFLFKFDPAGNEILAKGFNGPESIHKATGMEVDNEGNIYIVGSYSGKGAFDDVIFDMRYEDLLFLKLSPSGNVLWVKNSGGGQRIGSGGGTGIGLDASGNSYVIGSSSRTTYFGSHTLSGNGHVYVVKYDPSGNVLWAKKGLGHYGYTTLNSIAVEADGSFYAGGAYQEYTFSFNGFTFPNTDPFNQGDMFLMKCDDSGQVLWGKSYGKYQGNAIDAIAIDKFGNCYVKGYVHGQTTIDGFTLGYEGNSSYAYHFIGKLAPAGAADVGAPGVATSYCAGSTASVSFATSGSFAPGNTFTVQLSDAAGCFTSPLEIGSGSASPVSVSFSENLTGSGYRMRVVSSAPYAVGVESAADIAIYQPPVVSLQALEEVVCSSTTDLVLTGGAPAGGTYAGPGVANGIFNAAVAGAGTHEITYTYTNSYGCQASAVQPITVATCTGIRDRELERNAQLYPNPTTGKFMLTVPLPAAGDVLVRVVNLQGRAVLEKAYGRQHGEFTAQLDLSAQAKGLYLLQILLDQQLLVKQVVLQ